MTKMKKLFSLCAYSIAWDFKIQNCGRHVEVEKMIIEQ